MRYTAWGEVRYQAGTTSTGYTYTGQYSNTAHFGLMFYNARWYDPALGRFAQADSIVPGGVQGYDRYAYTFNNPIRYTDPSGHDPWWNDPNFDYAERHPAGVDLTPDSDAMAIAEPYGNQTDYMDTYTIAGIGVQNPNTIILRRGLLGWIYYMGGGAYGPAKVTDDQMNTSQTEAVGGNADDGYGLGMSGQDQSDDSVAFEAMKRRIQGVTDFCMKQDDCTSTDVFIAAAMAENGAGFTKDNMRDVINMGRNDSGGYDWEAWLEINDDYNLMLIRKFANDVSTLGYNGWSVPNVNWVYTYNLVK